MKSIEPQAERQISERELEVLSAALERSPCRPEASSLRSTASSLRVVGQCQCGCGSVSFSPVSAQEHPFIVADAVADSAHGLIGVLVWALPSHIVELELYSLGAEPAEGWPITGTVRPWEAGYAAQPSLPPDVPAAASRQQGRG